jgi:hypothetical protein
MAWTVEIRKPSRTTTLNINFIWGINLEQEIASPTEISSVNWEIDIDGELVDSDPSVIGENFFTYAELVASNFEPAEIAFIQDGTERKVLKPEEGFIGPFLTSFSSGEKDGGEGKSKMSYRLKIVYKSRGGQTEKKEDVYELATSLSITKKNGIVVRKVWKASAKSTSAESAEAATKTFTPSEKFITEESEVFYKDFRATRIWVWELEAKGIKRWRCSVFYFGGDDFEVVTRAGARAKAARFLKQATPRRIEVTGEIVAFTADIPIPADHFKTGEDLWKIPAAEKFQKGSVIFDEKHGEYRREYHEVYECVGQIPEPNHDGNHHLINAGNPPAAGAVAA